MLGARQPTGHGGLSGYCHLVPLCCCVMLFRKASAVWACQSGSFHLFLSDFLGLTSYTWNHWVKKPRKWLRRVVELIRAPATPPRQWESACSEKNDFLSFRNPTRLPAVCGPCSGGRGDDVHRRAPRLCQAEAAVSFRGLTRPLVIPLHFFVP